MRRTLIVLFILQCAAAFQIPMTPVKSSALNMAPRYDKSTGKWFATTEEEKSDYGPIGTLIRAGPLPFISRLTKPEEYDQAVLKYMAAEGCSRKEAQGNMDAYLENPNDWTYQKLEEKKGGFKKDYANANTDPKQLILSGTWALGFSYWFFTFVQDCIAGKFGPVKPLIHF
jgi:hypothetical protein